MERDTSQAVISLTEAPDVVQPAARAKPAEGFAPEPDACRLLSRLRPFAGFSSSRPHHADPSAAGHAAMTICICGIEEAPVNSDIAQDGE